jgi:predicted nucleotidyltransferase
MLQEVTSRVIEQIVQAIVRTVDPDRILLFGSRARGTSSPTSDLDLLIVEDQPFTAGRSRRKEMARIWQALPDLAVPIDILVYSREELEHWRHSRNHVIGRAVREGQLLYARA